MQGTKATERLQRRPGKASSQKDAKMPLMRRKDREERQAMQIRLVSWPGRLRGLRQVGASQEEDVGLHSYSGLPFVVPLTGCGTCLRFASRLRLPFLCRARALGAMHFSMHR